MSFSHVNEKGEAIMVDVGEKIIIRRMAKAMSRVFMKRQTLELIASDGMKKGDVLGCARIAGIMAAKKTAELIPLCHSLPIESVTVELKLNYEKLCVDIETTAICSYKTGIEMEALTAVTVSALTVYDMCKAVDKEMVIADVTLLEKTGGKSDINREKL